MGRGSAETTTVVNPAPLGLSHSFHVHAPVLAIELNHRAVTTQLSGACFPMEPGVITSLTGRHRTQEFSWSAVAQFAA